MKKRPTKIISFRVPLELGVDIDKTAEESKQARADFIKDIFIPAYEQHKKQTKKPRREPECV